VCKNVEVPEYGNSNNVLSKEESEKRKSEREDIVRNWSKVWKK
jgi:hypothetical protein